MDKPLDKSVRKRKHPLKVNVFECVRLHVSQLAPMFPYLDDGAMVPCASLFLGHKDLRPGRFSHFNTIDEVLLTLASSGGKAQAASLRVNNRTHTVTTPLAEPNDPKSVVVSVVTERNHEQPNQAQAVMFICPKCEKLMYRHDFDVKKDQRDLGPVAEAGTIYNSLKAAEDFNSDAKKRTCTSCGHIEPQFPVEEWGWKAYSHYTEVANQARNQLETLTAEVLSDPKESKEKK